MKIRADVLRLSLPFMICFFNSECWQFQFTIIDAYVFDSFHYMMCIAELIDVVACFFWLGLAILLDPMIRSMNHCSYPLSSALGDQGSPHYS